MKHQKSLPVCWRDAIRDSDLDATAKLVALVLSTHLNGSGTAYPSQETLAAGSSLSARAVGQAVERIERGGFVDVERTSGRANRYRVLFPQTTEARSGVTTEARSGVPPNLTTAATESHDQTPEAPSHEDGLRRREDGARASDDDESLTPAQNVEKARSMLDRLHRGSTLDDEVGERVERE